MLSPIGPARLSAFTPVTSPYALQTPPQAAPSTGPIDGATLSGKAERTASAAPAAPGPRLGARKLALAAVLALGGLSSMVGATTAMAAEPPAAITRSVEAAPTAAEEALARRAGLSEKAVETLRADPDLRARAEALPTRTADTYGAFNPRQKQVIARLLSGKTHVLFVTIDNREAFVNGRAAGQDAFPHMLGKIDEEVEAGRLSKPEGEQMKASLQQMKTLTPAQRDTVATLIHIDQGR